MDTTSSMNCGVDRSPGISMRHCHFPPVRFDQRTKKCPSRTSIVSALIPEHHLAGSSQGGWDLASRLCRARKCLQSRATVVTLENDEFCTLLLCTVVSSALLTAWILTAWMKFIQTLMHRLAVVVHRIFAPSPHLLVPVLYRV